MLSEEKAKFALRIIIPVLIAVLSIFVFSAVIPKTGFIDGSLESLENSKLTVMEFTGATLVTSLAISALPDDFATPIADTLADMNNYFVFILIAIFLERLIVVEGIKVAFIFLIPLACAFYILYACKKWDFAKKGTYKSLILAIALILIVPCTTHITNIVGSDYMDYVDETIDNANAGADKINGIMESGGKDETFFEKLSNAFQTAMTGMSDLLDYFNETVKRCYNSIAILIVTTFVMPILTMFLFRWLLKELFSLKLDFLTAKGGKS